MNKNNSWMRFLLRVMLPQFVLSACMFFVAMVLAMSLKSVGCRKLLLYSGVIAGGLWILSAFVIVLTQAFAAFMIVLRRTFAAFMCFWRTVIDKWESVKEHRKGSKGTLGKNATDPVLEMREGVQGADTDMRQPSEPGGSCTGQKKLPQYSHEDDEDAGKPAVPASGDKMDETQDKKNRIIYKKSRKNRAHSR
ncbi:MAG: hypothetical protein LUF35_02765 [Lachnospiraceae bacterium]|nr:hypothetical protein [Lachnospiraceae bacterium]